MSYEVVDDPAAGRFEIRVDGERAGSAQYARRASSIVVNHVTVEDRFAGRGVGSALARGVLEAARADGVGVVPNCSFLRDYLRRHEEYQDLVAVERD